MTDFSQYGEQLLITAAFKDYEPYLAGGVKAPLRFLDVGACHPTDKSNTRALYELGWSGVMIEPSPQPMLNLLNVYGNDKRIALIQACAAISNELVRLHVTDDMVSTNDEAEYQKWKDYTHFRGTMLVPPITLDRIQNDYGHFDFINLDAEGCSVDLFLHAVNVLQWHPHCWCVEVDAGRDRELGIAATRAGYVCHATEANLVMVAK